jgi:hypothetical protein
MANVISSLRTVQERLLAAWQTQQAAAKTHLQAAQTETSRTTTSFQALLSGKAAAATLPAVQGSPLGPAPAAAAATVPAAPTTEREFMAESALPAVQGSPLGPAPAAAAATVPAAPTTEQEFMAESTLPAVQGSPLGPAPAAAATTVPAAPTTEAEFLAAASAQDAAPTAVSVFGANPWITDPTGTAPDGSVYNYNPVYFATASTAAQVAQMVGGTVVASDQIANGGGFQQQQPNEMVKLANGTLINPGLVASFYTHGYPQSMIDQMIASEAAAT